LDIVEGEPLSTNTGRWLKHELYECGIKPFDCYIDYLMPSYPGHARLTSIEAQDEMAEYRSTLQRNINKHSKLKVLLLFGPEVLPEFGITDPLTKTRGFVFDESTPVLLPTFRPQTLFMGGGEQEVTFLNDLSKAADIAKNGFTRPPEHFITNPSLATVKAFCKQLLKKETRLYVDIEAIGSLNDRDHNEITMIGVMNGRTKQVLVVPFLVQGGSRFWESREEDEVRSIIREVLTKQPCVFHNAEYDIKHLNYQGFGPVRLGGDTMLLHHALHPELPHSLDYVTSVYGNIPYWKATLKKARHQLDIENKALWTYNARDCLATAQIEPELEKDCREQDTYKIYEDISMRMLPIVLEMNNNGLPVDVTRLVKWRRELEVRNTGILDTMPQLWEIHPAFNWDSRQHMQWLFYGQKPATFSEKKAKYAEYFMQGNKKKKNTKVFATLEAYIGVFELTRPFRSLPSLAVKKSKTGASTDDEMRKRIREAIIRRVEILLNAKTTDEEREQEKVELAAMRQVIDNLAEYAVNGKLLSTYTKLHIEPDGRVHPGFRVSGTKTGRLSSYSPNGQNLPPDAKKIFVAPQGWKFVQFDFTNLELVVLAYFVGIPYLIDVFKRGLNVHDENTKRFLKILDTDPNWEEWRRVMKMYVFGRNYGGGLKGMYRRMLTAIPGLQMTFKQFCKLDKDYFRLMPEYGKWYDETIDELRRTRVLHNAFGRIRIFLGEIEAIVREGLNFPIQGTAADIMAYGLIDFFEVYKQKKAEGYQMQLCLSVHDSAVVLAPESEIKELLHMFKGTMCTPRQIGEYEVPFTGDVKIMDDLKGKKKIKDDPNPEERKIDKWIEYYENVG
jgi:DNA polymerase I-like protein with 3'-5' exonuclease and polymerase domains